MDMDDSSNKRDIYLYKHLKQKRMEVKNPVVNIYEC